VNFIAMTLLFIVLTSVQCFDTAAWTLEGRLVCPSSFQS